jgi:hypothetical protein
MTESKWVGDWLIGQNCDKNKENMGYAQYDIAKSPVVEEQGDASAPEWLLTMSFK